MNIKKKIKTMGKCIIALRQEDETIIGQSVLIVDNGYSWLGQLNAAIEKIKVYLPKAEISVLTFPERKSNLEKDFSTLKFILPSERLRPKRYQFALQMLKMSKNKFDFVILFSLDITPLIAALIFFKSKVILYNQWGQWWTLKPRNLTELFKVTYVKKRTRFDLKNFIKRIGLFFVLLQRKDEEALRHSILLVDNGYALFEHAGFAIPKIRKSLPYANLSILTLEQRKKLFQKDFPDVEIIPARNCLIKRYKIARQMLRLRKNRYDYIILLSLDITPIIVSILFMKGKVLLYNQWHQWWSLKPKSMRGYLRVIPRSVLNVIIFVYLLISVFWIFLKRSGNVFRFSLLGKRV